MPRPRAATIALLVLTIASAAKKKSPDDTTQTLDLPKDPPMVAIGETSRLTFQVSPLSNKGLLSQQTRDALKSILKLNGGVPVIHIRAFVAGSGDLRRVPQIVSEVFTDKKMALPSVSVVQVGALSLEGAQVVLEAVSEGKRPANPDGLTFLAVQSPETLASALSVTCFVSDAAGAGSLAARFPGVPVDIVQTRRAPSNKDTRCEAVVRGGGVRASKLAFSGTQVAFGADEKAAGVAFQRLNRELPGDVVMSHIYALSAGIGEMARKVGAPGYPITVLPVEGVASIDGSFAVDAIAASK